MPKQKRHKTKYPGVYYIIGKLSLYGKPEKIFYIYFSINGKQVEEKAGRQFTDNMTAAKASNLRAMKIAGKMETRSSRRKKNFERITLNYLFNEFLEHKQHLKSLQEDIYRYNKYLRPEFGDMTVPEITNAGVSKFKNRLLKKLSPQSVKHILTPLKRITNLGHSLGFCPTLDFGIEMPKVDNVVTEYLTDEQYKNLMDTLDKEKNKVAVALIKTALFTGMRRGELFKLKWADIDFERGFINLSGPKGTISQSIPLNKRAREVLESVEKVNGSDYVFPGLDGKQRVTIQRPLRRIRKNTGLSKDFRPLQGLRHIFASELASSGNVDMYTLQRLMTHKDFRMTQRYAHLRDETLKKASEEIGDALDKKMREKK